MITGASSGLGARLATLYAAPGVALALVGRDAERLQAVGETCTRAGAAVSLGRVDLRDHEAFVAWLSAFDRDHPVDVVIASAGISGSVDDERGLEDPDLAVRQIEVNLIGAMRTLDPLLPGMIARRRGAVAVVASVAGLRGLPYSPAYSASKAGVRTYGEALRALLKPQGVRVTVVTPGFFDTPMTDRWQGSAPFLWSVDRTARTVKAAVESGRARVSFPWPLNVALRLADIAPPFIVDPILRSFHFHILPPT